MTPARHVGIVAVSAEGAALCYRTICEEGATVLGPHDHPEVSMHTYPLARYMRLIEAGRWDEAGGLLLESAGILTRAGAEILVCPDNTLHQALDLVRDQSPVPWLHIAEEVAAVAAERGFARLGVLGTRYLMEGPVYPRQLEARVIAHEIPSAEARQRINDVIFDDLVYGRFEDDSRAYFVNVIESLRARGCDAVVLGCTEIPLLVSQKDSPLPVIDSTRTLARAALRSAVAALLALLLICVPVPAQAQTPPSGEAIYKTRCASCHDRVDARIPSRDALTQMSPARILRTLDFGLMMSIAYPLTRGERQAVAAYVGQGSDERAVSAAARCAAGTPIMAGNPRRGWNSWSPSPANTRYQAAAAAGLTASQVRSLDVKWAYGFAGDVTAFAAPTVVRGTLFVGSASGRVQALDARTGCVYWTFEAQGPVRAAMTVAADGTRSVLLFSDQNGGVYAVDARSGMARWTTRVETHEATRLTASIVVHDGLAFVPAASWEETRSIDPAYRCCTFRGSVTAVRVRDGSVAWKTYFVDEPKKTGTTTAGTETWGPSGAGVWASPTIDAPRGLLYVTTGDNYSHPGTSTSDAVVALQIKTGRIVWAKQITTGDVYNSACGSAGANCPSGNGPDFDFGSSALLVHTPEGRDVLIAGQKSGVVTALDPVNQGAQLWQARVGKGGVNGGVQWGMASDGRNVYAAVSDVVRLRDVAGAAPIGDAQLDPAIGGGLTALRVSDGSRVWFAPPAPCTPPRAGCSPAQPGAVTAIDGVVFSGSMDGHIRAFSTADGTVLWDFDTRRSFATVNGVAAKGGSLDGAGPVVVDGMVFVNSGYPRFGGAPGNVLLAFAPRRTNR